VTARLAAIAGKKVARVGVVQTLRAHRAVDSDLRQMSWVHWREQRYSNPRPSA